MLNIIMQADKSSTHSIQYIHTCKYMYNFHLGHYFSYVVSYLLLKLVLFDFYWLIINLLYRVTVYDTNYLIHISNFHSKVTKNIQNSEEHYSVITLCWEVWLPPTIHKEGLEFITQHHTVAEEVSTFRMRR